MKTNRKRNPEEASPLSGKDEELELQRPTCRDPAKGEGQPISVPGGNQKLTHSPANLQSHVVFLVGARTTRRGRVSPEREPFGAHLIQGGDTPNARGAVRSGGESCHYPGVFLLGAGKFQELRELLKSDGGAQKYAPLWNG